MKTTKKKFLVLLLALLCPLSAEIRSQSSDSEEVRRVQYVGGVKADVASKPKITRVQRRRATLGRSEISETNEAGIIEQETFDLINLQRIENGLSPVTWDLKLAALARNHSRNMARHGFFSHVGLNGRTVDARAVDSGIDDWQGIGENIAFSQGIGNPGGFAVERWLLSPGHRRNMLDRRWNESGLGVAVTKDGKYFFTQIFIIRD